MSSRLQKNFPLLSFNTFGIEACAKYARIIEEEETIQEVVADHFYATLPMLVLGGGSNVLLTRDFDGLLLLNRIKGKEIIQENEQYVWLRIGAGEVWQELVEYCIANDWGGIENLSLIPGSVGAAPIQNIGAYGAELQEVFVSLEAIHLQTGNLHHFERSDCRFGYRNSIFKQEAKGTYLITRVVLCLQKPPHRLNMSYGAIQSEVEKRGLKASIQSIGQIVSDIRRSKLPDPAQIGNAGSFFKNPVIKREQFSQLQQTYPGIPHYPQADSHIKIPAAWLIQTAGWKGFRRADYGVHAKQALVLVNHGGAAGKEILTLSQEIKDSVFQQFGISLEREVQVI